MTDQSTVTGVLIGGTFALVGTVVGSTISLWNARAERKERRWEHLRTRLEEAADLTSKSVEWIVGLNTCRTLDDLRPYSLPPPTRRLYVLSKLYFPSIDGAVSDYHNALIGYYHLALDSLGSGVTTVGAEIEKQGVFEGEAVKLRRLRQVIDDALSKEMKRRG